MLEAQSIETLMNWIKILEQRRKKSKASEFVDVLRNTRLIIGRRRKYQKLNQQKTIEVDGLRSLEIGSLK